MESTPAMAPPQGKVPNFEHPHNLNNLTYGVLGASLGLTTIALLLRIYSRWFVVRQPFVGDYTLIASYCFFVTDIALVFKLAQSPGIGVHQYELYMDSLAHFMRDSFIASNTFPVFITLIKVSISLEWLRIFVPPGTRNLAYWACHTIIWGNIVFYALMIILVCASCTPFEYAWNKLLPGSCRIDTAWTNLGSAIVNLITDIFIFVVPQNVIWKLQMTTERKVGVAAIFSIGVLGVASAALRVGMTVLRATSKDFTYTFSAVLLCALAEGTCAMLVVCGPSIPKAISGLNVTKVASTMRSWMGTSRERLLRRSKNGSDGTASHSANSWPMFKGPFTVIARSKSHVNDQSCNSIDEHHLVPRSQQHLRSVASGPSIQKHPDYYEYANHTELGNSQILRSTHFELAEDYGATMADDDYRHQYSRSTSRR